MKREELIEQAFAMPFTNPAYPKGPYRFRNREYFIISYLTDPEKLRAVVPEPLSIDVNNPIVHYEFIRMPDSSGFGDYTESGQVITVFDEDGNKGNYTHSMYLDDEGPIAAGREIWGFPKKLATPVLKIETDTLIGTLNYGSVRVATGTMGFKHVSLDVEKERLSMMSTPNYLLKIMPHVDGSARICELVRYYLQDVEVKEAYTGPVALELFNHALAPVADLPILKIVGAKHVVANLTLGLGEVALDYLAGETRIKSQTKYRS
jgi:acetoacetate decarboxylase